MSKTIVPKSWFETWHTPRDMFRKADDCMSAFEPDEILGTPDAQHLFDAYVAGLFGWVWNDHRPCMVRLADGDFPDARLRDEEGIRDFEITMADRKDREIAAEHRRIREMLEQGTLPTEPIDSHRDRQYALEAVPRVCRSKVKKYLGKEVSDRRLNIGLLIYLNILPPTGPVLSNDEMAQLTAPWKGNFTSIWLLCGLRVFRAWPSPYELIATTDPFVAR